MRIGLALPAYGPSAHPQVLASLLFTAEDAGYDGVWFADHIAVPLADRGVQPPFFEALTMCGWALSHTSTMTVGTDALVAAYRHPLQVAAAAGTLALLYPGRLVLGVATGHLVGEFAALGADYETRAAAADAMLAATVAAWQGTGGVSVVQPGTPPPLWVGGNGPAARERAALLGDGWHPLWPAPADYAAARREIEAARGDAGRNGAFTYSYSSPARILGEGEQPPPARSPAYAPPRPTDAGRPRLVGTAAQVRDDVALLSDAGVEHLVVHLGADPTQVRRFAAAARLR
jgi:alkanesulfonate monooxygenase SsuD/methylene tetrahydromethanopterin reductase-like flavin-dependent oxidoreductase (luciferase family)